ncbi:hypothetical protein ABZ422_24750 [Micromonospora zamorensis]|uniref:hypothetical protein n=1 Tax=Micromonospora zamorensis TaxID=709883 RepID=UPI000820135B|nr:hypothetical protein [Micromonospora zamorensis]WSK49965.1 hypothetical protein OG423_06175 [Micromonospora zamorensis]WTE87480.1 hypothetical protein OHA01_01755 [Micromonospora zamorensis]SCG57615.1 hypothetical protein GA0070619_3660 [Micromonospora zamorensis]
MAIEWHCRVNRSFTLREALAHTGVRLAEILGQSGSPVQVQAAAATVARRRGGTGVPASDAKLDERLDPLADELNDDLDMFFELPECEAGALISADLFLPGSEDPESGLFVWVSSQRDPASQVLAIAATIALAECGDGEVIDEYGYLSDVRLNPPAELFERLRVTAPQESLDAAVDAVLAKTRLKRRFPRSDTPPEAPPKGVA